MGAWTVALVALLAGCSSDPTGIEFEVIEETTFAASLNIDLSTMMVTGNGSYVKDLVVGTGALVELGKTLSVNYTGWLSNGTQFASGLDDFILGLDGRIQGYEEGLIGMMVGGTRLVIMPPAIAYGDQTLRDSMGNILIPAGSILIFELVLNSVN